MNIVTSHIRKLFSSFKEVYQLKRRKENEVEVDIIADIIIVDIDMKMKDVLITGIITIIKYK